MSKRATTSPNTKLEPKKQKTGGFWALGLIDALKDPNLQVFTDDKVTVIRDKYAKAKYHYLVMPNEDISSLKSVTSKHLDLLKHMHKTGLKITTTDDEHKLKTFKLGYHSEPSMTRLHLHVISDDMDSECLKTKKHWNSFTTSFFLDSQTVIDELEKKDKVSLLSREKCKQLIESALMCHKCNYQPKNMPDLKKHIKKH